jgi:hypothetical protein
MSSRRPTNPGGLPYGDIVNLQGSAGNKAVAQMLAKPGPPADGVATFQRIYVARRPTETVQRRDIPLTADDVGDLKRVGTRAIKELAKLEQERAITTVEAEQGKERIEELMRRSKKGRGDRNALIKELNHLRAFPALVRKRAAAGRSTKGKKLVTDFKLTPPVIRVGEGEAARISFVVKGTPQSISAFIFEDPNREGTAFRIFNMAPTAGYHQVIWDGTFEGIGNRPPKARRLPDRHHRDGRGRQV